MTFKDPSPGHTLPRASLAASPSQCYRESQMAQTCQPRAVASMQAAQRSTVPGTAAESQKQPPHIGRQAGKDFRGPQMISKSQLAGAGRGQWAWGMEAALAQRVPRAQATKGTLWMGPIGWASCELPARLFLDLMCLHPHCHSGLNSTVTP